MCAASGIGFNESSAGESGGNEQQRDNKTGPQMTTLTLSTLFPGIAAFWKHFHTNTRPTILFLQLFAPKYKSRTLSNHFKVSWESYCQDSNGQSNQTVPVASQKTEMFILYTV